MNSIRKLINRTIVSKLAYNYTMQAASYKQSHQFQRAPINLPPQENQKNLGPVQLRLLQYVIKYGKKNDPVDVINKIDDFCYHNWMMNLGDEKARIVKQKALNKQVKKVLEIGGYCGYSALVFANQIKDNQNSKVYTIQINSDFAQIARKIHDHAGLGDKVHIHVATVQTSQAFLKQKGPFDMIFIDHVKGLYLSDFKKIEAAGAIKKGTRVVGDNIIYPGAPQYLQHFKKSDSYESTLYYSYLQYSNSKDAVLVSIKK